MTLTVADYFCGGGGSTSGFHQVPGVRGKMAANHWDRAIETHNANFPDMDHDRADIAAIDPRRHPATDLAWFSPECTNWSIAKGVKCDYDGRPEQLDLFDTDGDDRPLPDEAAQRSRMLMQDVPRFTEVHRYRAVIVENVTDVLKWAHLDEWLQRMRLLGYDQRTIVLNSAFATAFGPGAPQLRDRVYFVFWRSSYRAPDFAKWTRPRSWCPSCGDDVRGIYTAKPGPRRAMRYGAQYTYRCPRTACRGTAVHPYCLPAAAAIDWTLTGQRIGDRARPLQRKTLDRIQAGIRRHSHTITAEAASHTAPACPPMLVPAGGTWNDTARPAGLPMLARTTRETDGVFCPPFLAPLRSGRNRSFAADADPLATIVADGGNHALIEPLLIPVEGRDGKQARSTGVPMRAQTARHQDALVVPLRNNGIARPAVGHPLVTVAAGGTHQALLYGYDTGMVRPVAAMPMPAQTTVAGDAVLGPAVPVEDCTFRMLDVDEIRAGMAFGQGYVLLGSKRERVRLLGNAVTPPTARDLVAAVVEAITGDAFDLAA